MTARGSIDRQSDVSRTLLALSVDAAGVGTFEIDVATRALSWNRQMFELLGVDPEHFEGELAEAYRHIHPDDAARVAAEVEAALGTLGEYGTEFRVVVGEGRTRYVSARGRMLTDATGTPVRLVGAAYDITAERQAGDRVRAVLESMAVGYLSLDADWRITFLNAQAEQVLGMSRDELLGRTLGEAFPATVDSVFEERYRHTAETGEAVTFDAHYPAPLDKWFEIRAVPENGGIALYFLDITDRRRTHELAEQSSRRNALLAAVTQQLSGTMDAEQAVALLAQLVVPTLADWCIVTLVDDEGPAVGRRGLRDIASWHVEETLRPTVEAYMQRRLPALREQAFLMRALATGQRVTVPRGASKAAQDVLSPGEARDLVERLAPESLDVLPLRGRGRTVGLLTLFSGPDRGPMAPADLATAMEVADRAGLALDSSRLYRQQRDLAAGLQRSLLTEPVQPDHVQIVVRYIPAAEAAEVGGDWYDAFLQPVGATVLVIGDVIGHDTEAAAAMGQARTLLRGLAAVGDDGPAEVLRKTDVVMETLRTGIIATALVARLEQEEDERVVGSVRLRWSNAGHPPAAVVAPDGAVTLLTAEKADLLLGVLPRTARTEHETLLERGATVLLYTDGLIERRDQPIEEGLELLRQRLTELAPRDLPLDGLVDQLLADLLPPQPEDDVALIAVRLHDQRRPRPAEAGPNRLPSMVPDSPEVQPDQR